MSSSAYIPHNLLVILEYIVEDDPQEKNPSSIMTKATWEWVKNHPSYAKFMMDTTQKHGKEADAAPAEDDPLIGTVSESHTKNMSEA